MKLKLFHSIAVDIPFQIDFIKVYAILSQIMTNSAMLSFITPFVMFRNHSID